MNFQMFKLDLEKAEETEIKMPTSFGSLKKQENFRKKHLLLLYWPCQAFDYVDNKKNCGKFFKRLEYQTIWPASWETCIQVRKQQLELDTEQQTCTKYEKVYVKAVYCHSAYLTYMQNTSWETLGWQKHKLESGFLEEISITSRYADDTTLIAESEEELKSFLMKVKEESEKVVFKLNIQKTKVMASCPITSW